MVDNRYATALVIACVLSLLATVYLSVAVGTQHWYQYSSPSVRGDPNVSELRSLHEEFMAGEFDEKTYSDTLFRLNGTVGLWWRCVLVPASAHWYREPGTLMMMMMMMLSLAVILGMRRHACRHDGGCYHSSCSRWAVCQQMWRLMRRDGEFLTFVVKPETRESER